MNYRYRTIKFRYTTDLGITIIRTQRIFMDNNGTELVPVLQTLLDHRVLSQYKSDKTENGNLRHFLIYKIINNSVSTFKVYIPNRPGTSDFRNALLQMRNVDSVVCFDYFGEVAKYG